MLAHLLDDIPLQRLHNYSASDSFKHYFDVRTKLKNPGLLVKQHMPSSSRAEHSTHAIEFEDKWVNFQRVQCLGCSYFIMSTLSSIFVENLALMYKIVFVLICKSFGIEPH